MQKLMFTKDLPKAQVWRDWIELVTMTLESISPEVSEWWADTVSDAKDWHRHYMELNTAQRARMKINHKPDARYDHIEKAVRPMIITAMPKYLQDQLLARGEVTCLKCVYESCVESAPGGMEDKSEVLSTLQFPKTAQSAPEAMKLLRVWRQAWHRTEELRISRPDATLM